MSVFDTIGRLGVVPVIALDEADRAEPLGAALLAGGLACAEITFRTEAAAPAIGALTAALPELLVGAGTVLDVAQAEAAVSAGARFIVTPGFDADVVDWCRAHAVPIAPGVMTPTEINQARNRGLDVVKFFPAEAVGGAATLAAIGAAQPGMRFIPTGGIDAARLAGYLRLPMVVACGGSWLAPRHLIAAGDFGAIQRLAAAAVTIVRDTRAAP